MRKKARHVLGLSGGKDSAALALYLKDQIPEMEYFFCDTQKELPETYEFLVRLEAALGKKVNRLNAKRGFDHWLKIFNGYLPSSKNRWCTRQLKLKPFEDWVGDDDVVTYVGIRADEDREGYLSHKPNIRAEFPFKKAGLIKQDIIRILEENGVGLPKYYTWRSRSGCYFCFFQRKIEWLNLKQQHPELFKMAAAYEKPPRGSAPGFYWSEDESLEDISKPQREKEIRQRYNRRKTELGTTQLIDILDADEDQSPCLICTL